MKWARIAAILPVGKLFDRIFAEALTPGAVQAGAEILRIEPEFSSTGKLGAICNSLEEVNLVLADISARNPNVLYLAGYARGIGREVLFIAHQGEDFPFDRTRRPPIIYGSDLEFLKRELHDYLRGAKTPERSQTIDARQQFLSVFGDLLEKHQHEHEGEIHLENPTTYVLVNQDMELALVQDLARRARELGLRIKLM